MYKTKYLCALLALSVYVGYYHLYRRSTQNSQFFRIGSRKVGSQLNTEQLFFLKYWDIQRRMRFDYEQLLEPCKNKMKWSAVYPERTFYMITSSRFSNATLHVKPVGQYSRLVIETFSVMNTRKNIGGDWWRVFVKGTSSSVHVTVLDRLDGTYEASFLILQPGKYEIDLYLEYTLCDGMKDPPEDFFSKGNDQGKGQNKQALPGYREKPYLEQKYQRNLSFRVERGHRNVYKELLGKLQRKAHPTCLMWDGFGEWNNHTKWMPSIQDPYMMRSNIKTNNRKGVFWIYGDSTGDLFYKSILNTPLCKCIFRMCNRTYNWVYNLPNGKPARPNELPYTGRDFNLTRVLHELESVLRNPEMDENSVLLLNYGLHYAMSISLEKFQIMMDEVIKLLKSFQGKFKGTVIWKTTTALQKWKYGTPTSNARHSLSLRFLTQPRVGLFNAVSTSKVCAAGYNVLDVFPMSRSYPNGTGWDHKPWDAVHYNRLAFMSVEKYLQNYFDTRS